MYKTKSEKTGAGFLIFLCWLAYSVSYLGKVNYSANIAQVIDFYNVSKDEIKYIEENRGVDNYYLSEDLGYSYLPNVKETNSLEAEEKPIVKVIAMNDKFLDNMVYRWYNYGGDVK